MCCVLVYNRLSCALSLSLSLCACGQFSNGSFIDLYLISLQYSNSASVLQSVADLSTPPKLPKFVSVCVHVCKRMLLSGCICAEVHKNAKSRDLSFIRLTAFHTGKLLTMLNVSPQSSNNSSTFLSLMQSVLLWLKQALSGKVQHMPAASWQQPVMDTDPFNFRGEKNSSQSKDTQESEDAAVLLYHYRLPSK